MRALDLAGVVRRFPVGLGLRRREVLHGVDLRLERGQRLALVGPNGSGKSSLLRILAGVDVADAGQVQVLGGSPRDAAVRARVGYCPEDSPFPGELSGQAAMELLAALAGLPRRAARSTATRVLEQVGLLEHRGRPLGRYSRGMQRRFTFGQALLGEPDLVLLDEPTAGLDAPGFGVLDELLKSAAERGATVVLASHVVGDVHAHADRLAILLSGRVAAEGTPEELFDSAGRRVVEFEGLDDARLEALRSWADAHGARVAQTRPGGRGLLELFRLHGGESA